MEDRILFGLGKQREFLNLVVEKLSCGSLRGILQFGFDMGYDSLKSYYTERRLLSKSFFDNLCYIAKININDLDYQVVNGKWGVIRGGMKSKRGKIKNP